MPQQATLDRVRAAITSLNFKFSQLSAEDQKAIRTLYTDTVAQLDAARAVVVAANAQQGATPQPLPWVPDGATQNERLLNYAAKVLYDNDTSIIAGYIDEGQAKIDAVNNAKDDRAAIRAALKGPQQQIDVLAKVSVITDPAVLAKIAAMPEVAAAKIPAATAEVAPVKG